MLSTIHQPRSSIFAMFDLLLLIADSKLIFYGPAHLAVRNSNTCRPCLLSYKSQLQEALHAYLPHKSQLQALLCKTIQTSVATASLQSPCRYRTSSVATCPAPSTSTLPTSSWYVHRDLHQQTTLFGRTCVQRHQRDLLRHTVIDPDILTSKYLQICRTSLLWTTGEQSHPPAKLSPSSACGPGKIS